MTAYNNSYDAKVDLTAEIVKELAGEGLIAAIKEFKAVDRKDESV